MDRRRAAAALLALAACIACSSAAPTANDQTALELMDGPTEGCYYNFQHYGEGDRIMTNEPCLNCTCHNRMLMCYLRVCPFTKPIGQDCTVEKRADQCCPIVTCPDVPVDLLTSTSTSSPAEYGTTGVGKLDKYGCSIHGKYFSEGSKVPSTPNKPCEHCYCIRNMTTCVMQECTLHVDGCTPIYHKDVCCPVRYSCDHPEDEILLLDDMTTTVRPTPGFLLTTTTVTPVTQLSQDCVHDNQVFPDGTLIKTEKACEHCYCMKGDIVCVVQECGTPMENEGKNCTSLPPRHGQCCPDTYICEGDDRGTELTTEVADDSTPPPRRVGVEGSGYRNEPDEPFTEISPFETEIEGSGEDYTTAGLGSKLEDVITEKVTPDVIDEILFATTEKGKISQTTEADKDLNTIPDIIPVEESSEHQDVMAQTTEPNVELTTLNEFKTTVSDEYKTVHESISKEENAITTESAFRKEDNNIAADEILTVKEHGLPTTVVDLVDENTVKDENLLEVSTEYNLQSDHQSTTQSAEIYTKDPEIIREKEITTGDEIQSTVTEQNKLVDEQSVTSEENIITSITTIKSDGNELPETTSINPVINEIDENVSIISPPGRIPGEGDCLLNGITYTNNTIVPSINNCHTSCKCTSSIIKCDPIICSSPPEYMENNNDCQPIYDSPDACCPTYVCSAKETIPPQSHNQMSGTESPKPLAPGECNSPDCISEKEQEVISETPSKDKQEQSDCDSTNCGDKSEQPHIKPDCSDNKCQVLPVVACEGENCLSEPVTDIDSHKLPDSENTSQLICNEKGECKKPDEDCKDNLCKKHEISETEVKAPTYCTGSDCKSDEKPTVTPIEEQEIDLSTEITSVDKVTQMSVTKLDIDAEYPDITVAPLTDVNITEIPTTEKVKHKDIEVPEVLTTVPDTFTAVHDTKDESYESELSTTEFYTEKSEISVSTEKAYTDTQTINEIIKTTEPTNVEQLTENSELLDDSKDKVTEVTQLDGLSTASEMVYRVTTESIEIKKDDKFTDGITTDNIDSTSPKSDKVSDIKIPETSEDEILMLTTPDLSIGVTEKVQSTKDSSEIYGTKEEKTTTPVPMEAITEVTENTSIEFNEVTEMNKLPQITTEPEKQIIATDTDKSTDIPEEAITDGNRDVFDDTQSTELHKTDDDTVTTDSTKLITESNAVSTEASQPMQTIIDEVTKNIPQEIVTEKQESYTEPSDYFTTKPEQTSSELSNQHEISLSPTQDNSEVTEKETAFTENPESVVTKYDENVDKIVTEKDETGVTIPEQYPEEIDRISTVPVTETKTETTFTEKEIIEYGTTRKQDSYTEGPVIQTTSIEDIITKDYEIKQSTELPTMISTVPQDTISTVKITEDQDIITKGTEKPITGDSDASDDVTYTKSESIETSTSDIGDNITEKLNAPVTESSEAQITTENESSVQPTSSKPSKVDEQDLEDHKLVTTLKDNIITPGLTTQDIIAATESQTESPAESDKKSQDTISETQEKLPSDIDDNIVNTATEQSFHEKDESPKTPPPYPTIQTEHTTVEDITESQEIHEEILDESRTPIDSSTKTSVFEDKQEESTDISKPNKEIPNEISTPSYEDKQEIEKESPLLTETKSTVEDTGKTTASVMETEKIDNEQVSHVTESVIIDEDKDTNKHTTSVIVDIQQYETTEKTVVEEERLPSSTTRYAPVEDIVGETTLPSLYDVSTEKIDIQDVVETSGPIEKDTTKSDLFTKFEELSTTKTIVDENDKERVTELPYSHVTPNDLEPTPIQKDKLDETQQLTESDESNQPLTTAATIQQEDDTVVTKTPVLSVTVIDREKESTILLENLEPEIEVTTKIYDDKILENENGGTIISELYTTEPPIQTSDISKDNSPQHHTISTEIIATTESPEYISTSVLHETTLSSLREAEKEGQQITTTEKVLHETGIVIDLQPTAPELEIQNTERTFVSTIEDEIFNTEEEKPTDKTIVDLEEHTSYPPVFQVTTKEDVTTDLSRGETSTIPSKQLGQEKDDFAESEIHLTTKQEPSTEHPTKEDIVTEKEESLDTESHTMTTIKPTITETEKNPSDTITESSTDNVLTDKSTTIVTEEKEPVIVDQEVKSTETPVFPDIITTTNPIKVTEKQETTEEPITEKIDIEETQETDQKESSTEPSVEESKLPEQSDLDSSKVTTVIPNDIEISTKQPHLTDDLYQTEPTTLTTDNQAQLDKHDELITSIAEHTDINIETTKATIPEKEIIDQTEIYSTEAAVELQTEGPVTQKENIATESSSEKHEEPSVIEDNKQSTESSSYKPSETTSFLVELEEHTHSVVDEITTKASLEEIATTQNYETQTPERGDQNIDDTPEKEYQTSEPSKTTKEILEVTDKPATTVPEESNENVKTTDIPVKVETEITFIPEKSPTSTSKYESLETKKDTPVHGEEIETTTPQIKKEHDLTTESIKIEPIPDEQTSVDVTSEKPLKPFTEKEPLNFAKDTTSKISEETSTYSPAHITKPKDKPTDTTLAPPMPEVPKPGFIDESNEGIPSPDFPPTGGYGQETDYIDEDQAFGPGTCRYGGKVYVSAQQIPRDDPCDFCFCFRSDIICLQQSCPPPIHGCHEEPIQGFCCPRYECPVSMATTLNVTTTTTTTTTTLPPHFLPHAYKGAAQRRGCQIKGHTYKVGEVVRASSGPCLHCTCGGDGQMKCDPKACTPEPMLRQMIAAAVSAKRRR